MICLIKDSFPFNHGNNQCQILDLTLYFRYLGVVNLRVGDSSDFLLFLSVVSHP